MRSQKGEKPNEKRKSIRPKETAAHGSVLEMTLPKLAYAAHLLNFCIFYYTVLLVRCTLVSFVAFSVVFTLRKTILKGNVFLKGALWVLFIPVLFAGMEKRKVSGTDIYVTDIPVTPFTVGALRPKIVIPEMILNEYDVNELQTILLHEKIHIRRRVTRIAGYKI